MKRIPAHEIRYGGSRSSEVRSWHRQAFGQDDIATTRRSRPMIVWSCNDPSRDCASAACPHHGQSHDGIAPTETLKHRYGTCHKWQPFRSRHPNAVEDSPSMTGIIKTLDSCRIQTSCEVFGTIRSDAANCDKPAKPRGNNNRPICNRWHRCLLYVSQAETLHMVVRVGAHPGTFCEPPSPGSLKP